MLRFFDERRVGFDWGTPGVRIPIVVSAVIDDLAVGDPRIRPDADAAYKACGAASAAPVAEGNIGAGSGATIGKMHLSRGLGGMKGGLGTASVTIGDVVIGALAVVNAAGDVLDWRSGRILAGARRADGSLADSVDVMRSIVSGRSGAGLQDAALRSTTLAIVATNVALPKTALTKIAMMANCGAARAIRPYHTTGDGDQLFAASTAKIQRPDLSLTVIGSLAADVVADAIVRAVRAAKSVPGWPGLGDRCAGGGRPPLHAGPAPIPDRRHVLSVSPDIEPVFGQGVGHPLLEIGASSSQLRQPVDGIARQMKPIEVVQHGHVEGRRDRAFLFVSAHVQIAVIRPAVGQPMNQKRVAVIRKDDGLVAREQEIEIRVAQPVWMFGGRLQPHEIDDVDHAHLEAGQVVPKDGRGGQGFERRHVARRGHDQIRLGAFIVARPLPDADPGSAVPYGGVHPQPLRRRVFTRNDDVDVLPAAQTVVHHAQETVGVRRQIHAHDLGLLVEGDR